MPPARRSCEKPRKPGVSALATTRESFELQAPLEHILNISFILMKEDAARAE